jgi:hypothetical protein
MSSLRSSYRSEGQSTSPSHIQAKGIQNLSAGHRTSSYPHLLGSTTGGNFSGFPQAFMKVTSSMAMSELAEMSTLASKTTEKLLLLDTKRLP